MSEKKGFTLIELIVAISILTIGILGVVRSLLSTTSVLDTIQTRLLAVQLLTEKAAELEQESRQGGGVVPSERQETVKLLNHDATFSLAIVPIEIEELKDDLIQANLSVTWRGDFTDRQTTVAFYLARQK